MITQLSYRLIQDEVPNVRFAAAKTAAQFAGNTKFSKTALLKEVKP